MDTTYLVLVLLLVASPAVWGQFDDCAMLQQSELGDITTPTTSGLLAQALAAASGQSAPSVQLLEFNVVCLAQGTVIGTYRSLSLIARYRDNNAIEATTQLHLQCVAGVWSINNFGTTSVASSDPTSGALNTTTRTDCALCINPVQDPAVSDAEHCQACVDCTGSGRCTTTGTAVNLQTCCNYFGVNGSCALDCSANSDPNTGFQCTCDAGFTPSGSACVDINECAVGSPCQNGGTCNNVDGNFTCTCVAGFTGATCMAMVTPCDPTPCQNGGTCTATGNDFSCNCPENWGGTTCSDCTLSNCDNCNLLSNGTTICATCNNGYSSSNGVCVKTSTPDITGIVVGVVVGVVAVIVIVIVTVIIVIYFAKYRNN